MQILFFTRFRTGCWSHRPNEINVGVSHFKSLKETVNAIVLLEEKELIGDLANDNQLLLSQKHVIVMRVRWYELHVTLRKKINEFRRQFL